MSEHWSREAHSKTSLRGKRQPRTSIAFPAIPVNSVVALTDAAKLALAPTQLKSNRQGATLGPTVQAELLGGTSLCPIQNGRRVQNGAKY